MFLIRKEFLQIFRNKGMLPIILIMPVIQLLVLSYAADFEIRNLKVYWVDQDHSSASALLHQKLNASPYFVFSGSSTNPKRAKKALDKGEVDLVINIPLHFERNLTRAKSNQIQLLVNAIDGTKAGLGTAYANILVQDFAKELRGKLIHKTGMMVPSVQFKLAATEQVFWYNPELNYKTFMVPGILVMLITMISVFISSMNIVRERELGTIEQLNVTPIKKHQFIIGKLAPLWVIGLFEFTLGLLVGKLVFSIPIVGSIFLLYGFAAIYLMLVLGIGMFISTFTETQQQAMFISWFFLVIFLLMGGLFTAIENMPSWAQKITLVNPVRYFVEVIRLVMLKGAGFSDIKLHFLIVSLFALIINGLAVLNYRKVQ